MRTRPAYLMHDLQPVRALLPLLVIWLVGVAAMALTGCTIDAAFAESKTCSAEPTGARTKFRHKRSRLVANLGDPHHRGLDLIAPSTAKLQSLEGKIAYGKTDKDLEDEDVEIFVCRDASWKQLGTARTSEDGYFKLDLTGDKLLPLGLHDLYLSVVGDRTGTRFVGLVAAPQSAMIVSDVDGTLTSSEKSFYGTVVFNDPANVQPSAAAAMTAAAAKGFQPVYVTARGSQFTADTRRWFAAQGFPPGPIRFTPGAFVIPGKRTVEYKTHTIKPLAAQFKLVAGIGNRASDIAAYTNAGLAPDRIFIKLPEFADELKQPLEANKATGFAHYKDLLTTIGTL